MAQTEQMGTPVDFYKKLEDFDWEGSQEMVPVRAHIPARDYDLILKLVHEKKMESADQWISEVLEVAVAEERYKRIVLPRREKVVECPECKRKLLVDPKSEDGWRCPFCFKEVLKARGPAPGTHVHRLSEERRAQCWDAVRDWMQKPDNEKPKIEALATELGISYSYAKAIRREIRNGNKFEVKQ